MNLSLDATAQKLIADRVNSGMYATPEDVVTAALFALAHEEDFGTFAPGELDALIEQGESSGPPIEGEKFLAEWRALRASARAPRA